MFLSSISCGAIYVLKCLRSENIVPVTSLTIYDLLYFRSNSFKRNIEDN